MTKSHGGDTVKIVKKDNRNIVPQGNAPMGLFESIDRTFEQLRDELDNLFWGYPAYYSEVEAPRFRTPHIDMLDKGDSIVVNAEMPGIPRDNIEINVDESGLEISGASSGESEENKGDYYRKERYEASFYRYIPLPEEIKPEEVKAKMNNGVLEITLPKKSPVKKSGSRKVKVE